MCESAERPFSCQAVRHPCEPLSPANRLAYEVFVTKRTLGSLTDALQLFDLELDPRELEGLRLRIQKCCLLWPKR